eukprot:8173406-Pyramimonas_sp.AAC.1
MHSPSHDRNPRHCRWHGKGGLSLGAFELQEEFREEQTWARIDTWQMQVCQALGASRQSWTEPAGSRRTGSRARAARSCRSSSTAT